MKWLLIIPSWLVSLLVTGGGVLLATVFWSGVTKEDRNAGLLVGLVSVAWLAFPAGGTYLLLRTERTGWGIALLVVGLLGAGLLSLIGGAISAAGQ